MRVFFLAGTVSLVLVAATFACSSSSPATETVDAGKDSGKTPPVETPPVETPPVETPPVVDPDAGGDDDDAGSSSSGGTTTGDAGASCLETSFREGEPNDTNTTGTPLTVTQGPTVSFCGTTTKDNPDFFTFKTPDFQRYCVAAAGIQGGNVTGTAKVGNGQEFTFTGGGNFPNITTGEPFVVKVTTNSTNTVSYRVKVKFSPNENENCGGNF